MMGMTLSPNATIDLQLHTVYSDGRWTPDELLDYLRAEQFALAAITDHDRVDTVAGLLALAAEKGVTLLPAVEMSSMWHGTLVDFLCYGFDPTDNTLDALAQDTTKRQRANSREVFANLLNTGLPLAEEAIEHITMKPAAHQLTELIALVTPHTDEIGKTLLQEGFAYFTHPPAAIVEAAHASGAVCILAHPGRTDGFVTFDRPLLDALRAEAPIDGIEVYYPLHTPDQTEMFADYAAQHNLLVSTGSDSHARDKPPIAFPAEKSAALLERLGITIR